MRPLSRREKIIGSLCIGVIAAYVLLQGVVHPWQTSCQDIVDRRRVLENRLAHSRAIVRKSADLDREERRLKGSLGEVAAAGNETAVMMSRVEATAGSVHIVNMRPLPSLERGLARVFLIEVSFDGGWPSIAQFIYLAQRRPNAFKLEELNIENYSNSPGMLRGRAVFSCIRLKNENI
jgi:hypothetical protein